jgi:thiamine monophosphate kinase
LKIRDRGEFELVARNKDRLPAFLLSDVEEIGDSGVIFSLTPGKKVNSTVDLLFGGVHFYFSFPPPGLRGRKMPAVAIGETGRRESASLRKQSPDRGSRWT